MAPPGVEVDVLDFGGGAAAPGADRGHVDVAQEGDQLELVHAVTQDRLQVGLVEHVRLGVAVGGQWIGPVELGQRLVVGRQQPEAGARDGDVLDLLGDAEGGEDPVDLVVEVDRSGLLEDVAPPVENQGPDAGLGEQDRCGDTRGPGADDDDVGGRGEPGAAHHEAPRARR